jgi:hypothetical protein
VEGRGGCGVGGGGHRKFGETMWNVKEALRKTKKALSKWGMRWGM